MGIRGLKSFITNRNHEFMESKSFRDTKFIIDGNSLMYFLANERKIYPQYGGNYNAYKSNIDAFFNKLTDCKIKSIVVLDGCKVTDNSKLKTLIKRHRGKLKDCSRQVNQNALPLLMRQEFKEGLQRNNILCIVSHFEADDAVVELANYFDTHILSSDSDFYIYNLKKGVIAFDTLKIKDEANDKNQQNILQGDVFYSKNLEREFPNINAELVALGAILHNNDYINFPHKKLQELCRKGTDDFCKELENSFEEDSLSTTKNPMLSSSKTPRKRKEYDTNELDFQETVRHHIYEKKTKLTKNSYYSKGFLKSSKKSTGFSYPNFNSTFTWVSNIGDYGKALITVKDILREKEESYWEGLDFQIQKYIKIQSPSETLKDDLSNYKNSKPITSLTGKEIPGKYQIIAYNPFQISVK